MLTLIDFMNKTSCRNVNMFCFFFWLINKVYEKTMKMGLLISLDYDIYKVFKEIKISVF